MSNSIEQSAKQPRETVAGFRQRMQAMWSYEIGVIPLPIFAGIALIVYLSAHLGFLPENMIGGLAVIMTMGIFLGQVGQRIPVLKEIGGAAILCLMLPSVAVFYGFFGPATVDATKILMKDANFLYFVIASLVVGSILGMSRFILVQGILRMFVPLVVGTLAAVISGLLVANSLVTASTTPFSSSLCRLLAAVSMRAFCRCRWLTRRSSVARQMSLLPNWYQRQ